jgi:HPt (histidine-containing phosphotransfer) domain-containing protein
MAEMLEDTGLALFHRLAELFEVERIKRARNLRDAVANDDRATVALEAHGLKTAAAYICAPRLRALSRRLEFEATSASGAALAAQVDELIAESAVVGSELVLTLNAMSDEAPRVRAGYAF